MVLYLGASLRMAKLKAYDIAASEAKVQSRSRGVDDV